MDERKNLIYSIVTLFVLMFVFLSVVAFIADRVADSPPTNPVNTEAYFGHPLNQ